MISAEQLEPFLLDKMIDIAEGDPGPWGVGWSHDIKLALHNLKAARQELALRKDSEEEFNRRGAEIDALLEQLRAQGLSQEDRAALDAGATALQERGEFHIYKDGKVYARHECNEMAAILRRLGGQ